MIKVRDMEVYHKLQGSGTIYYGTCSTAAATAAKTVACESFKLETGAKIIVKFTVTNTASSPTLNVNSTGAKNIFYNGATIASNLLIENKIYEFVYDGTQYNIEGDPEVNSIYSGTEAPASSLGKNGDIYILLES